MAKFDTPAKQKAEVDRVVKHIMSAKKIVDGGPSRAAGLLMVIGDEELIAIASASADLDVEDYDSSMIPLIRAALQLEIKKIDAQSKYGQRPLPNTPLPSNLTPVEEAKAQYNRMRLYHDAINVEGAAYKKSCEQIRSTFNYKISNPGTKQVKDLLIEQKIALKYEKKEHLAKVDAIKAKYPEVSPAVPLTTAFKKKATAFINQMKNALNSDNDDKPSYKK